MMVHVSDSCNVCIHSHLLTHTNPTPQVSVVVQILTNVPLPKPTTVMVIGLSVSTPWGVTSADVEVASLAMALTVKVSLDLFHSPQA